MLRFLILIVLFSVSILHGVSPLKDLSSAVGTAAILDDGAWITHKGHGQTHWLSWLPNAYTSTGFSDFYLFEGKDVCRCAKARGHGLNIVFLGGDSTRLIHMTTHQLFTKEPFEVRKNPEDCDNIYSNPDSPCGHLVASPLEATVCNGSVNIWSLNFDRLKEPVLIKDILASKSIDACKQNFDVAFIMDPRKSSIDSFASYLHSSVNSSNPLLKDCKILSVFHNVYDPTGQDDITYSTRRAFQDHGIPFLDFNGIFKNFTAYSADKMTDDKTAFKSLQTQLVLNTLCDISPEQSMLFGSKVGSFMLHEKKHFEEGSLVRPGNSKEIYLYRNESLHAVPNWDTFLHEGFKSEHVKAIPPDIFNALILGAPLPPCSGC